MKNYFEKHGIKPHFQPLDDDFLDQIATNMVEFEKTMPARRGPNPSFNAIERDAAHQEFVRRFAYVVAHHEEMKPEDVPGLFKPFYELRDGRRFDPAESFSGAHPSERMVKAMRYALLEAGVTGEDILKALKTARNYFQDASYLKLDIKTLKDLGAIQDTIDNFAAKEQYLRSTMSSEELQAWTQPYPTKESQMIWDIEYTAKGLRPEYAKAEPEAADFKAAPKPIAAAASISAALTPQSSLSEVIRSGATSESTSDFTPGKTFFSKIAQGLSETIKKGLAATLPVISSGIDKAQDFLGDQPSLRKTNEVIDGLINKVLTLAVPALKNLSGLEARAQEKIQKQKSLSEALREYADQFCKLKGQQFADPELLSNYGQTLKSYAETLRGRSDLEAQISNLYLYADKGPKELMDSRAMRASDNAMSFSQEAMVIEKIAHNIEVMAQELKQGDDADWNQFSQSVSQCAQMSKQLSFSDVVSDVVGGRAISVYDRIGQFNLSKQDPHQNLAFDRPRG